MSIIFSSKNLSYKKLKKNYIYIYLFYKHTKLYTGLGIFFVYLIATIWGGGGISNLGFPSKGEQTIPLIYRMWGQFRPKLHGVIFVNIKSLNNH